MSDPALPLSEGDVNVSPARAAWRASLSGRARDALDEDERYFLRQSLSTPCLTEIVRAEGAVLTDIDGRRILDFHGNSVHQLGHGHPKVIAAIVGEMETPAVLPAPLRQRDRDRSGAPSRRNLARRARQGSVRAERRGGDQHGAQTGALRDRAPQDAVAVGTRSTAPISTRSASAARLCSGAGSARCAGRRAPAAARSRAPLLRRRPPVRAPRRLHRLCARGAGRRQRADRRTDALDDGRGAAARFLAAGERLLRPPRRAADFRRNPELPRAAPARSTPASNWARRPIFW